MSEKPLSISRRKFLAATSTLTSGLILGAPAILTSKNRVSDISDADYFVLIADPHIDENPHRLRSGTNMFNHLEITVNRILNNDKFGQPLGVIILGDIANTHGFMGEYGLNWALLRHLRNAGIPVHFAMGNHDNRDNFFTVFPDQVPEENPMVQSQHVEIVEAPNTYHFILDTLDRVDEYITGGALGSAQLKWLDETLGIYNDKPVMLHGHHYPWLNTQTDGSIRGLGDIKEMIEITQSHRHVKGYYFGHSHRLDINPYGRVNTDLQGLNLLNVPTLAGHTNQPVGYIHAFYYPDKADFEVECIDTSEQWHGMTFTKTYRS